MKKIIVLIGICAACLAGCDKEKPTESAVQVSNTKPVQSQPEPDQAVHNEQLTVPDRPMPKMSGKHKY